MKKIVNNDEFTGEHRQLALILFFLSSGIFLLPMIGIGMIFIDALRRLSEAHEWLFYGLNFCGALIVVFGMYTLERVMPRKLAGWIGLVCWVILYVVAWNFSASL